MSSARQKSEWKVYFKGSFWGHHERDHAGKEIAIRQTFFWGEEEWLIPSLYVCGKGIVIDFCKKIPVKKIQEFMDKWNFGFDDTYCEFSQDDRMLIDAENPLNADLSPHIILNRNILTRKNSYGFAWIPSLPESRKRREAEEKALLSHYGLDPASGWCFRRVTFPWRTRRKPVIRSLRLHISQSPVNLPGPHFCISAPGDTFRFTHPTTGVTHTLTIQERERQQFEQNHFGSEDYLYPTHMVTMTYTLSPDLSGTSFAILDCAESDQPRRKLSENDPLRRFQPEAVCDTAAISVIGGAGGQTGNTGDDNAETSSAPLPLHSACSSLHFEPADEVTWKPIFLVKTKEDIEIPIDLP